ncbi:glycosyltransferase family 2 protein [Bordetella sp. 15P40C-2]|uniref:glycosyltransferase family 2 protein n=1 Tax=Bordetella sp. 15P40C-2 TaxID=2572246 RepID=UPI0013212549|nr:glycosyltransferase [Bordetella sp. 15P40C-2]MVW71380.1 glycosyltransferase [Bordetella sp. 15P40C-2]
MTQKNSLTVTVILCTHNRQALLKKCLDSLAAQTADQKKFDVLIIDNASADETATIANEYCKNFSNFRYHLESRLGLARARNTGLELTNTPLAAFTDDDAIPQPDWVEKMLARFEELPANVAVLAGEIIPIWEQQRPAWLTDPLLRPLSARLGWDTVPRLMRASEWVCEVNCCYRTEVIKKYSGFPESLGRKGDILLSGENYVNDQIFADGYTAYFDPNILVEHFIPANRTTVEWFMRRSFWQGITASVCADHDVKQGRKPEYYQNVKLPSSVQDWESILDPANSPSVEHSCELASNLGYALGMRNMVIGR